MTDVNQMRELLRNNVLEINFRKVDGSLRKMFASTNPLYIPEDHHDRDESETTVVRENPNLVVIDTEINQWRSIRPESIVNFSITNKPVLEQEPYNKVAV